MFVEGKIKTYHAERGFGFIEREQGEKDLFFHIKDLPNRHIEPKVGEKLRFSIVEDAGKLKAEHIVRLDVKVSVEQKVAHSRTRVKRNHPTRTVTSPSQNSGMFTTIIGLIVILGLGYAVYGKYLAWQNQRQSIEVQRVVEKPAKTTPQFKCDGREHCSQMTSYEEALFFIRNCPNTKMDGDGDGIPCERQF